MKKPLHQTIKDYRIVSISALLFISYLLNKTINWVMDTNPAELGEAVAVSGIIAGLVGAWKFTLDFARSRPSNGNGSSE